MAEAYRQDIDAVLSGLETVKTGLIASHIHSRLHKYGHNEIMGKKKISAIVIFFRQFLNPLVYILIIAASIKVFIKGPFDAIVILCVLLFMAVIGFFQEFRAQKAMDSLMKMTIAKAKVRRDGKMQVIEAKDLVPGDIIILEAGDKVPADCRLIEAVNLKVSEAALTGESVPVDKSINAVQYEVPLADRKNMLFTSTAVVYGRAVAVVTATGMNTEIGKIASAIQSIKEEKTTLQKSIDKLGFSLIWVILAACTFLVILGTVKNIAVIDIFMIAVAAAVAAIPEGIPAVVTVVLAVGMQRMAAKNAIIRKLVAVETLGSTTVICSDKTGTLTYNQMTLKKCYVSNMWFDVSGEGYNPQGQFTSKGEPLSPSKLPELELLLRIGLLCNDSELSSKDGKTEILGDPTEGALVVAAAKAGYEKHDKQKEFVRLDEIPFQSENRFMVTLHSDKNKNVLYIKGAPEQIISMSAQYMQNGNIQSLSDEIRSRFISASEQLAENAMRVLAFACKEQTADNKKISDDSLNNLTLVGLCGLIDPPRSEAKSAIKSCQNGGIKVVMVTGDNPITAVAVGKELGLDGNASLTGSQISKMSDEELERAVCNISVFARIEPLHKLRIVEAFRKRGHIVAMTGDGVNDAPALEAADIGIAMGTTGTDVAKDASDMVLVDDNFNSIEAAVEEGRSIFNKLRNVLFFMMTTCFGELLVLLLCVAFTGQSPLAPIQILWINLVTGALIAIPLGLEAKVGDELSYPPRHPSVGLLYPGMILRIIFMAGFLGIAAFLIFLWTSAKYPIEDARAIVFCSIVIFEWLVAFNARADEITIFRLGVFKNTALVKAILAGIILQIIVIYVPFMNKIFETIGLKWFEWAFAFMPGILIFVLETLRKIFLPKLFSIGKWAPVFVKKV
jgi:Ca2+-transporting ATPase